MGGRASEFQAGGGESVKIGATNHNSQKCLGHRKRPGNLRGQFAYKVECLCCGHVYGANGCDMHERKCPYCQGGEPGIDF
ncbi:MAG: hypothetical protein F4Y86_12645 [Gammaproteobacteria bacterium]|nr:hypothetical protein [Gammaproteobacteria bacterium]